MWGFISSKYIQMYLRGADCEGTYGAFRQSQPQSNYQYWTWHTVILYFKYGILFAWISVKQDPDYNNKLMSVRAEWILVGMLILH